MTRTQIVRTQIVRTRGVSRQVVFAVTCISAIIGTMRVSAAGAQSSPVSAATDTAIQPGHLDFRRYDTPGACLQAAGMTRNVVERAELDTSRYAPEHDTLPTAAVTVARTCGARFNLKNVPARELLTLAQLSLMTGDDATAATAAERWLAAAPDKSPIGRAWTMLDLVTMYMQARPMRFVPAEVMLARMDSLGSAVALPRMIGHMAVHVPASRRFDVARIERDGMAILTLDPTLKQTEREQILAQTDENVVDAPSLGLPTILFDVTIASAYRQPNEPASTLISAISRTGFNAMPPDTLAGFIQYLRAFTTSLPLPPIAAKYWFGNQGPHTFPVPGKVSMYVSVSANNGSYEMYAMIRRLHEKYGDSLNITLLTKTEGYFHDSPPLEPAQEVEAVRKYFLDYLKLPVNVAMDEAPFTRLPDGRRVNGMAPFEKSPAYASVFGPFWNSALIDQKGRSLLLGLAMGNEGMLEAFIDRALGRKAVSTGMP